MPKSLRKRYLPPKSEINLIQQSGDIINVPDKVQHYIEQQQLYTTCTTIGTDTMDIQKS